MKKITRIILLVLTLAILAALPFAVSASEGEASLTIKAANLSFEDSVYPIFAVSGEGVDLEDVKLLVWTSPKDGVDAYVKGTENAVLDSYDNTTVSGVACKKFKYTKLYSRNMADAIYVRAYAVVDGEEVYSGLTKYSIIRYAYNKLGYTGTASSNADFRAMLSSMLQYGADSQKYFGYNTDRLATDSFYKVTVDGGLLADGTTSGLYLEGDTITVTAPETDADGRVFAAWLNSAGEELATTATATVAVGATNDTYTATYKAVESGTEGLIYTLLENDTYAVTGYEGTATDVIIPSTYEGKPVTGIGSDAFYNCKILTSIEIPDSVTIIGSGAFRECGRLADLTLGRGVKDIGANAFWGCNLLENLYISDIEAWCNITNSNDSSNPLWYSEYFYLNGELVTELIIPETVTKINNYAFINCDILEKVVIPNSVTSIGMYAFYSCSNISSIEFGNNLEGIGYAAFRNCHALVEIELPNSVVGIDEYAFYENSSLTSIVIGESVTRIGDNAFSSCFKLAEVINKSSLNIVAGSENYGEVALRAIEIHDGDSKIVNKDDYLFYSTNGQNYLIEYLGEDTEIVLPDNYNGESYKIYNYAFYDNDDLTSIVIGDGATSIGNRSFANSSSLTRVESGNNVISIGNGAFLGCSRLKSIELLDSVTSIGDSAFRGCTSLTSIELPASVTSIGNYAFYECSSLTSIVIPDSVTSIGDAAFYGCTSLANIYYRGTEAQWNNISKGERWDEYYGYADGFYGDHKLSYTITYNYGAPVTPDEPAGTEGLIYILLENDTYAVTGYEGTATDVIIPSTYEGKLVTSIGESAFYRLTSLTSVVIGGSVTSIGEHAFYGCDSLSSIKFAENGKLTSIGYSAFGDCTSLTSIEIPNSVANIGNSAFLQCDALVDVVIGNSVTSIGERVFANCNSLVSVKFAENSKLTSIGYGAFNGTSLISIEIPHSVTTIGDYAFAYCHKLVEVINKSSLNIEIGSWSYGAVANYAKEVHNGESKIVNKDGYLFYTYDGVNYLLGYIGDDTDLILPDNYNGESYELYEYAFYNRDDIMSVVIGDSVTSIGGRAFYICSNLTSVVIPADMTSIGSFVFEACRNLASIKVDADNSIYKDIDGNLYTKDGTTLLQYAIGKSDANFTIPDSVTSINEYAFIYCESLENVVIPDNVTSIGRGAFQHCSKLANVKISARVTYISAYSFYGCTSLTGIEIPAGVTSIGENAFSDCASLMSIVIPNGVTSIDSSAFSGCTSLTSIVIPDSVTSICDSAFYDCTSLTSINYRGTEEQWNAISKGSQWDEYYDYDNYDYKKLNYTITFGYGAPVTPDEQVGTEGLIYTLQDDDTYSVTGYTGTATDVIIPSTYDGKSVTSIGWRAFESCRELASIAIPDSIRWIGAYAFQGCHNLTRIDIPNSVTSIGPAAFALCTNLTSINIPDGVDEISYEMFYACYSLASIDIPDSVTSIGAHAFAGCTSLTSIVIPNKVTTIRNDAFSTCSSLTRIVIPDSVTSIYKDVFIYCYSITTINYRGTEEQWNAISKVSGWDSYTSDYTITYNYTGE